MIPILSILLLWIAFLISNPLIGFPLVTIALVMNVYDLRREVKRYNSIKDVEE